MSWSKYSSKAISSSTSIFRANSGVRLFATKVVKNGRSFSTDRAVSSERVVHIYSLSRNWGLSNLCLKDEILLEKIFRRYSPNVEFVETKNFEKVIKTSSKTTLVVMGGLICNLKPILPSVLTTIKERVKNGDLNYLGIEAGAVIAGNGYNSQILSSPDDLTLRFGNFWAGNIPYILANRYITDRFQPQSLHVKRDGDLFEVSYCISSNVLEVSQDSEKSSLVTTGEYIDGHTKKLLGAAELKGTYGKGRYHVITHKSVNEFVVAEKEINRLADQLREVSLDEAVRNVLEIDQNQAK